MTNEEMQRAMDFIVQQQAESTSKIDALAEAQTRNTEGIQALLVLAEMHGRELQAHTEQIQLHTQQILSLGETTKATDERLNVLINAVERQMSNGRNGN